MKAITIMGKHNIDKMTELENVAYQAIRKHMTDFDDVLYDTAKQIVLLREMNEEYTPLKEYAQLDIKSLLQKELEHKIQGYKGQDIKKVIHQEATLINLKALLAKLCESKLECFYCTKPVLVLYKNVREPSQWTLDRLDNSLSHTSTNTCIACLKCNLQRRIMNTEKFTFTKRLKINKV